MAKKSSVYFGPPLEAITSNLRDNDTVSGKINRMAERYAIITKRCQLSLNDDERQILLNVLNGTMADQLLIRHLADEVADSDWRNDPAAGELIERLQEASIAELFATVECLGY